MESRSFGGSGTREHRAAYRLARRLFDADSFRLVDELNFSAAMPGFNPTGSIVTDGERAYFVAFTSTPPYVSRLFVVGRRGR